MTPEHKQRAFLDAFLPIHARLERYVRAMSRDDDEARDTIGDTVLVAFESFERVTAPDAFLSYVFTIARRTLVRHRTRARRFTRGDELTMQSVSADTHPPDAAAEARLVHEALQRLSHDDREVLVLHELADLPLQEVAALQQITLAAVKQRVRRARMRLAELLRDEGRTRVSSAGPPASRLQPGLQED